MFWLLPRGRAAPRSTFFIPVDDGPIRLDEARLAAWARALGVERPAWDPPGPSRPHRGQLPDVDVANVVAAPRRRFLWWMVTGALASRLMPVSQLPAITNMALPAKDVEPSADQTVVEPETHRRAA